MHFESGESGFSQNRQCALSRPVRGWKRALACTRQLRIGMKLFESRTVAIVLRGAMELMQTSEKRIYVLQHLGLV